MPQWRWVLTDNNLSPVGEMLNVYDRKLAIPLNRLSTASYRLRLDHPFAEALQYSGGYIKIYRDDELLFYGPNVSVQETVSKDSQTVAVNAVDGGWVMQKRLIGKSKTGYTYTAADNRGTSAGKTIGLMNTDGESRLAAWPNFTFLTPGKYVNFGAFTSGGGLVGSRIYTTPALASGLTGVYTAQFKTAMEVVRDLSVGQDGFDWSIVPFDNHATGVASWLKDKIGEFRAWPLRGQDRENAVFEWGTGRNNIESYTRSVNRETHANKIYHIAAPGPDAPGYPVVSAIDPTSISSWGLLEDLASADLLEPTLRQRLVDEHKRVRAQPRQTVEITPHVYRQGIMPNFNKDFEVGDNVRTRIKYGNRVMLDALVRVWGVTFDVDTSGSERMSLMLSEEA
jgi:hypothetical protein